jgi:hypothetical protein
MPTITITREQSAYLERTARQLSSLANRKVGKREVLSALLDTAIEDEAVYDPETSEPLDPYRKRICQAEREARTASFDVESLLTAIEARS